MEDGTVHIAEFRCNRPKTSLQISILEEGLRKRHQVLGEGVGDHVAFGDVKREYFSSLDSLLKHMNATLQPHRLARCVLLSIRPDHAFLDTTCVTALSLAV